jgi:hypothetical protein
VPPFDIPNRVFVKVLISILACSLQNKPMTLLINSSASCYENPQPSAMPLAITRIASPFST